MSSTIGLNIVFAGTPDFAATHLLALIQSKHNILSVYTQPDRPAGRGKKLTSSPVKRAALDANIKIYQPVTLKDEEQHLALAAQNADLMIVVAYGLLLPKTILNTPKYGCINVHASLLPYWRGAAPIQRAIEAGDSETGITIMQMDEGLDTGDMLHISRCPILPTDNATTLHDRLAELGPAALLSTVEAIQNQTAKAETQDNTNATYAHKLKKEEALIDWNNHARDIDRRVRAFNPFPVAYTLKGDERIRVLKSAPITQDHSVTPGTILNLNNGITVACADNSCLRLEQIQLPGKKAMPAKDALNGFAHLFEVNTIFNSTICKT